MKEGPDGKGLNEKDNGIEGDQMFVKRRRDSRTDGCFDVPFSSSFWSVGPTISSFSAKHS